MGVKMFQNMQQSDLIMVAILVLAFWFVFGTMGIFILGVIFLGVYLYGEFK